MRPSAPTTSGSTAEPLTTESIVSTAGDFVDEFGPEAMTLTKIANELGVTQPALYRHVDGLADVWRELGLATRATLADNLAEASVGRTGADAVRAVASTWRDFGIANPGRYRAADRHADGGDPALEAAAHRTIEVLERALQGFDLDADELRFAATTLRSSLHGFVSYELGNGHADHDRVDASFDRLVDHLCTAFSNRNGAST
ncbi:MAG: TetR/AcrR family transcriptional regulator [Acidimicrobiales bacterium]